MRPTPTFAALGLALTRIAHGAPLPLMIDDIDSFTVHGLILFENNYPITFIPIHKALMVGSGIS